MKHVIVMARFASGTANPHLRHAVGTVRATCIHGAGRGMLIRQKVGRPVLADARS
jgi:hypothetical protein